MIGLTIGNGDAAHETLVGDLSQALDRIAALADGQPLPLVTDPRVLALHGAKLAPIALQPPILIPEGETAKNWDVLAAIIDGLAKENLQAA